MKSGFCGIISLPGVSLSERHGIILKAVEGAAIQGMTATI
jgi:hypothetical protein